MSDGYRNGAFALGLITGGGLALNLFLWADYKAKYEPNQTGDRYANTNSSEVGHWWDWIIGTFVSPSDTLANWIMAVFSIIAVIYVYKTYYITLSIGQAQVRAYLDYGGVKTKTNRDTGEITGVLTLKNSGQSPARNVKLFACAYLAAPQEDGGLIPPNDHDILNCGSVSPDREVMSSEFLLVTATKRDLVKMRQGILTMHVVGLITYRDVFGGKRNSDFHLVTHTDGKNPMIEFGFHREKNQAN